MTRNTVALVPAYNEAPRITAVLDVVTRCSFLDRVYVIDDGSSDGTGGVARGFPVQVLAHKENMGKGAALQTGLDAALAGGAESLVFLDADLLGLGEEHILTLLGPLENPGVPRMTVGVFKGGQSHVDLAQHLTPILNGQRGLTRAMAEALPDLSWSRFGVEVLINLHARRRGLELLHVPLRNISHVTKEQKLGVARGFRYRLQMYQEAIYAWRNYDRIVGQGV
jgi:glycosyltransferase involved in cell wall biosynthesis